MKDSILIIDDNEDILDFLSQVLGEVYKLHLAINGEVAQEILQNNMVNLIISDIMMPGIDGFQLCKLIKSRVEYCHIPIILLTAKNTYQAHIEGLEVGADAYIQKPFAPEFLRLQVANLLKNRMKVKEHFSVDPINDRRELAYSKMDEQFLQKLEDYIHVNMRDPDIDINKLADHMNMSRPTFYRKISSLSNLSPKALINVIRLQKAADLIAQNEFTLFEIAKKVGFRSQSVFGKNFQKHFKLSPMEYLNDLKKKAYEKY
ncbi:response regulator transcription factor [Desertivirga arenae]|uniref:response regulator transcription factor n=1 Tax=Desertivirga arenae TaxID=2810309 RepID=UPI001A97C8E5|nr:response regulator [Pedobacter sp. SYSU D00823]